MDINQKLNILRRRIENPDERVRIMIMGLGSVGLYLLDYLVSLADPKLEIIVCGRNAEKITSDVNIVRTAAAIRRQLRSRIIIAAGCDFDDVDSITREISRHKPDFVVNSSRAVAGLKYGSISWHHLRAYGIWSPLSVKYALNIALAMQRADSTAISINTSYSDAVIPWIKAAGIPTYDFGSGNLNHLLPRMKFEIARLYDVENLEDIDITLAASHSHDVVISKEGHTEGQILPLRIRVKGEIVEPDLEALLKACSIAMPSDQKRNMMNASSNFDIINSILRALREHRRIKIHTPGVEGEIGGYPYIIDGTGDKPTAYFDTTDFTMEEMRRANRASIYLDGIEDVVSEEVKEGDESLEREGKARKEGYLIYTDELIAKVRKEFGAELPKRVALSDANRVRHLLIEEVITPALRK